MFNVKVEGKVLEIYVLFNFKIFGCIIWLRYNDIFNLMVV
jgi:hypothetical protein